MHRISSSIVEHGTARLVFHEPSYSLKGILLNNEGASFSLNGHMAGRKSNPVLSESIRKMRITIVDDETGERFCIEDVIVNLIEQEGNGGPKNPKILIESPAIKFRTEEILIGMRADVEIRRYLDPSDPLMRTNGEKSPERRVVHIGKMQLRVIASQQRAANPAIRRTSISQPDESVIEWVQNDFLV